MDQALINRYAPGGDIYLAIAGEHGPSAANEVYTAARTGDRAQVSESLARIRYGAPRSTSAAGLFLEQIATDPLAAPLDSLNNQLGKALWNVLRNPWVLLLAIAVGAYFLWPVIGGPIKRRLK